METLVSQAVRWLQHGTGNPRGSLHFRRSLETSLAANILIGGMAKRGQHATVLIGDAPWGPNVVKLDSRLIDVNCFKSCFPTKQLRPFSPDFSPEFCPSPAYLPLVRSCSTDDGIPIFNNIIYPLSTATVETLTTCPIYSFTLGQ
jgi:hypothetical protein